MPLVIFRVNPPGEKCFNWDLNRLRILPEVIPASSGTSPASQFHRNRSCRSNI